MRPIRLLALFLLLPFAACGGDGTAEAPAEEASPSASAPSSDIALETDNDKLLYVLGYGVAQQLAPLNLSAEELVAISAGFADGVLKREAKADPREYQAKIQAFGQERLAAAASAESKASEAFVERMANEPGAEVLDSGLVFTELVAGTGERPGPESTIKAHYHGTLRDGRVFDSSVDRGAPVQFPLNGVVPCWQEGLQKVAVGGKAKLVCPARLAYGAQGRPPQIPPNSALVFEVELIEIVTP